MCSAKHHSLVSVRPLSSLKSCSETEFSFSARQLLEINVIRVRWILKTEKPTIQDRLLNTRPLIQDMERQRIKQTMRRI